MAMIDRAIPAVTIILMTIMVALPWGVSSEHRFLLPLLPLIVIHYWTMRRPDVIADWWVFAAGLSLDILSHGPLGFWALIYLLGAASARLTSAMVEDGPLIKWAIAAVTFAGLAAIGWCVSTLFYFEMVDWRPYLTATVIASLLYPMIGLVLRGLNGSRSAMSRKLLQRGQ